MLDGLTRSRYLMLFSGVYLAMFLIRVAFGIVLITLPHYVDTDATVYGLLHSSSPLLEFVTVLFLAAVVDRYGRKSVLLAGLALGAFSLYGLALTGNILLIGAINALHGVAAACILVSTLALIASYASPEQRGREMGLFNFSNMFGWVFGMAVGAFLFGVFDDVRYTFVLAGALGTAGLFYSNYAVTEPARQPASPGAAVEGHHNFRDAFRVLAKPTLLLLSLQWFVVFFVISSAITFFSFVTFGADSLSPSGGLVGLGILVFGGLFMASQLVFGKLSDKHGRDPLMLAGGVGFLALMLLLGYNHLSGDGDLSGLLGGNALTLLLLLASALTALAYPPAALGALADEAKASMEGATMSSYTLVLSLAFIFGPPIVGLIGDHAGGGGVLLFFVILATLFNVLIWLRRKHTRHSALSAARAKAHEDATR